MIKVNNLRFAWDKQAIIDIDTLHIQKGQHLFIEGPSGSGKSTLLNLLAGVLTAQSGEVCILGQQLNNLSSSQKDHFRSNHIGFIFQQFNLIPYLSVIDNITLPCSFSAQRKSKALQRSVSLKAEAIRLLNALGLTEPELLQRSVNELSVGQQQRVAAARAIFGSPEIIIADEPTSALDNDHRQAFIKILFDECEKADITLIFVSHDGTLKQHFDRHITLQQLNQVPTKAL
ncbi:ABC transporter ATP-binding protein [Vibrio vulnificus]|uniref:ABC transporter ATP-binding protein n=1 Tax=Vibrio vulnificus TaxID=672 RepID=UPI0009B67CC2|nr:ABC transporter ATP-binding protein [Vibrio vulnificus]OQK36291.1 Phosphonate-transporting ATPase [Vibrio vulnificus]OQK50419.1 Phosphonate-transporting ATPase [Vibrio vulnificus]OQK60954.1 Phosphonate-transporting ATPase [Vibrio vulnificus]OQK63736.1 Phosphonate-transporting ATPase [Vibrio vulnificus]POC23472.1 ABC transporter ATP-binding protein [Vibrio vulnificus]